MNRRLIVFARRPVLGRVKTRLAATVGDAVALDAHRRLLATTVALAEASVAERLELRWAHAPADTSADASADACAPETHDRRWTVTGQRGSDLGARMHEALVAALDAGDRPVLIGCDCPSLRPGDLADAFDALDRADAVFAPAEDGGYALIGLARPLPELFPAMPWGTAEVMALTRARLAAAGARTIELRTVWDVDVEADLRRWASERPAPPPARRR